MAAEEGDDAAEVIVGEADAEDDGLTGGGIADQMPIQCAMYGWQR